MREKFYEHTDEFTRPPACLSIRPLNKHVPNMCSSESDLVLALKKCHNPTEEAHASKRSSMSSKVFPLVVLGLFF